MLRSRILKWNFRYFPWVTLLKLHKYRVNLSIVTKFFFDKSAPFSTYYVYQNSRCRFNKAKEKILKNNLMCL